MDKVLLAALTFLVGAVVTVSVVLTVLRMLN
jgi:hypothetical protein